MVDHGQERTEAGPLLDLRVGERQGAHRSPVERAFERDDRRAPGVMARELDGALHRFGPRVGEEDAGLLLEGRDRGQALAQLEVSRLVEVGGRDVDELVGLGRDGIGHLRMRVAGGGDRDPGREVEELVAVDVGHDVAPPRLGDEWVGAGQRGAGDCGVPGDDLACAWPGELGDDVGDGRCGIGRLTEGPNGHVGTPGRKRRVLPAPLANSPVMLPRQPPLQASPDRKRRCRSITGRDQRRHPWRVAHRFRRRSRPSR